MSQRKAKEYRQAMEQYRGAVEDVDAVSYTHLTLPTNSLV